MDVRNKTKQGVKTVKRLTAEQSAAKAAAKVAKFCEKQETCEECPFLDWFVGHCVLRGAEPREWPQYDTPIQDAVE